MRAFEIRLLNIFNEFKELIFFELDYYFYKLIFNIKIFQATIVQYINIAFILSLLFPILAVILAYYFIQLSNTPFNNTENGYICTIPSIVIGALIMLFIIVATLITIFPGLPDLDQRLTRKYVIFSPQTIMYCGYYTGTISSLAVLLSLKFIHSYNIIFIYALIISIIILLLYAKWYLNSINTTYIIKKIDEDFISPKDPYLQLIKYFSNRILKHNEKFQSKLINSKYSRYIKFRPSFIDTFLYVKRLYESEHNVKHIIGTSDQGFVEKINFYYIEFFFTEVEREINVLLNDYFKRVPENKNATIDYILKELNFTIYNDFGYVIRRFDDDEYPYPLITFQTKLSFYDENIGNSFTKFLKSMKEFLDSRKNRIFKINKYKILNNLLIKRFKPNIETFKHPIKNENIPLLQAIERQWINNIRILFNEIPSNSWNLQFLQILLKALITGNLPLKE